MYVRFLADIGGTMRTYDVEITAEFFELQHLDGVAMPETTSTGAMVARIRQLLSAGAIAVETERETIVMPTDRVISATLTDERRTVGAVVV